MYIHMCIMCIYIYRGMCVFHKRWYWQKQKGSVESTCFLSVASFLQRKCNELLPWFLNATVFANFLSTVLQILQPFPCPGIYTYIYIYTDFHNHDVWWCVGCGMFDDVLEIGCLMMLEGLNGIFKLYNMDSYVKNLNPKTTFCEVCQLNHSSNTFKQPLSWLLGND